MIDIGGIEVVSTGSRILTAEDVTEVTAHIERLESENEKLRQAFNETLVRLVAANEVTVSDYMDDEYCDLLRELGIEVGE